MRRGRDQTTERDAQNANKPEDATRDQQAKPQNQAEETKPEGESAKAQQQTEGGKPQDQTSHSGDGGPRAGSQGASDARPAAPKPATPKTTPPSTANGKGVNATAPGGAAARASAPGPASRPDARPAAAAATGGGRPGAGGSGSETSREGPSGGSGGSGGGGRPGSGEGGARPPSGPPPTAGGAGASAGGGSGRGGGFGMGLLGGVVGGALVGFLVSFWFQSGDQIDTLRTRVDQMQSTLADATSSGQIETLATRIKELENATGDELIARLEALEAGAEGQGGNEEFMARMAEVDAALQQLPSGDDPRLAQLEQRLSELEAGAGDASQTGGQAGGGQSGDAAPTLQSLQDRMAALETRLPQSGQVQETSAKLQAATAKIEDTQNQLGQIDQRLSAAEQAESQVQQLSSRLDQLSQQMNTDTQQGQDLAKQIGALDQRIGGAESKLETAAQNRDRAASLALILGQLQAAIDEARPYETQVQTLSAMAGDDGTVKQAVSALEPGASSGVPTLATLRQSFEPVANEVVHAARAPDGNNLIDRATDNLMRLVTVRPVGGDVRGDSVEARVARAEASLDEGNLAAAVSELDQLQGPPADAAADWLKDAKARVGAEQAVTNLRDHATSLLTQTN